MLKRKVEPKIGDKITINGIKYKAVKHINTNECTCCDLNMEICAGIKCRAQDRKDGHKVIFVRID